MAIPGCSAFAILCAHRKKHNSVQPMELLHEFSDDAACGAHRLMPQSTAYCYTTIEDWISLENQATIGNKDSLDGDTGSPSNRSTASNDEDSSAGSCCTLDTHETDGPSPLSSEFPRMTGVDNRLLEACGPFAHDGDVRLLAGLLSLCRLPSADGDLARHLLRALEMMRRCGYPVEDMRCIVAMASVYFNDTYQRKGVYMDSTELKHVLVLALYAAHCYTQDEMCPLSTWHKWLFQSYCSLQELNSALLRMLQLRDFRLRVDDDELFRRCELIRQATSIEVE